METLLFWVAAAVILIIAGIGVFSLGTRSNVSTSGGDCEVDTHWWFGWWVRCKGTCTDGHCKLQIKWRGSEQWSDADVIPGGSVKWRDGAAYRCICGN